MTKNKNIPPTLADAAIRQSFKNPHAVPRALAEKIAKARRFVLDAGASAFLADLAHASFAPDIGDIVGSKIRKALDQTRELARAPHALTWFEYDAHAFRRRTKEGYLGKFRFVDADRRDGVTFAITSTEPTAIEDTIPLIGWLIEQERETQFLLTIFGAVDTIGTAMITLPFQYSWTTDDSVPTHAKITPAPTDDARIATGIHGASTDKIVTVLTPGIDASSAIPTLPQIMVEFIGELRFVLALLAAINDIPVGVKHVEATKGFVAKGRYRKFLSHSVISIILPKGRDPIKVARTVVAMSRRRAHQVRGHWRRDHWHPGERIWVAEHERGDATLGYVIHDYSVTHEKEPTDVD